MTIQLTFDLVDLIIFLIIAFIAGTAASSLLVRYRYRSALVSTILGMIGAFVGQYVFSALDLELGGSFFRRAISIADITIAFLGAVIILLLAGTLRRL
jgi:uncharacterized membrane protein YeaQ/YmgE (transglycosylase-associated protein family)